MLRKNLILGLLAALTVAPAASQASVLSRRLTIRYPGQDAKKHHRDRGHHEDGNRSRHHEDRRSEGEGMGVFWFQFKSQKLIEASISV